MNSVTAIQFVLHLAGACALGALVGLERQLHQRMAGTRTNALVAGGASAFVMAGYLIGGDPSAPSRMASFVISGVGFLGAGVIFKDGASVRGLNTAATVWCSAAIGVLAGVNSLHLASILAALVIVTNVALRPLLNLLHLAIPVTGPTEEQYEISITCCSVDEAHLRALLLTTISRTPVTLHAIHSTVDRQNNHTQLQTRISTHGLQDGTINEIAARLSIEPSVTCLTWSMRSP